MDDTMIIEVKTRSASCDGGGGGFGHPRIYLKIAPNENEIICSYCSRKFIIKDKE